MTASLVIDLLIYFHAITGKMRGEALFASKIIVNTYKNKYNPMSIFKAFCT